MRTVRTVAELRRAVGELRAEGRAVALVPTMGAFHEGHLSLMRRAGADGHAVVVSLFVNPTQFGRGEDLAAYPRDEARDLALARGAGVALVWTPAVEDVYPPGFCTAIEVAGPSRGLEGAARPDHFGGVATVVAKLLLAVRPDRAVFGAKDAQQVAVVRRLMRDLHLDDIDLVVAPVVREPDGLAMSSRNAYLTAPERAAALALSRALHRLSALAGAGETDTARLCREALDVMRAEPLCEPEYAAVVDPGTFDHLPVLDRTAVVCVAARVGRARLIDTITLPAPSPGGALVASRTRTMLKSKIHRATVTDANLDYVGSITIDRELMDLSDIYEYEQVQVLNLSTGARFETYAIEGPRGEGDICLNGAAARLAQPGDLVIVLTYSTYDEAELAGGHEPVVVHVDERNRPTALVEDVVPLDWEENPS
jgi:pantoate--beta-alanine ligase